MKPVSVSDSIVEEITIRGSAERIFSALTDPQQRVKWWGQEGRFQTTRMESDLRPGGKWMMSGQGIGHPFEVHGEYRRVEPPRLLEFTWNPSWQEIPGESVILIELDERDGVTKVRLTHSELSESARAIHKGWAQILGWLRTHVEG